MADTLIDPITGNAANVKNASTAPLATDKALVVAISPNSGAGSVVGAAAEKAVTATGASGAAVTATLPAGGANLFHYITLIQIDAYASAALVPAATPTIVTTTNLAASLTFNFGSINAEGANENLLLVFANPMKSSVANTATTIVAPAATSIIWNINVVYHVGA